MKIETSIFYSYQVINVKNNEVVCFGHGILQIDTTWKGVDFLECQIEIKGLIAKEQKNIDWTIHKLHLLAFNKFPE